MHNQHSVLRTITHSSISMLEDRNEPRLTCLKPCVHNCMYKQGQPWNLLIPNTAILRHSGIYTGMSFSKQGWSHRIPGRYMMLMVHLSKPGLETLYTTRSNPCCARVVSKPTQPPDSSAAFRGSLRSWTPPSGHLPLSCPQSSPSGQALKVVCCRRWAETCRAVSALSKGQMPCYKYTCLA